MSAGKHILSFSCMAMLTFYFTATLACTCFPQTPQQSYCNAKYVVSAFILNKIEKTRERQVAYNMIITGVHKITAEGEKALKNMQLVTTFPGNSCALDLDEYQEYLIAGWGSHVNLCSYVKKHIDMSFEEILGMKGKYQEKC